MYRDDGEEIPEWVKNEQEHFSIHRDKDGDGFMDNEEVIESFSLKYYLKFSFFHIEE